MKNCNQILLEDFQRIVRSIKNPMLFQGKHFYVTGATGLVGSLFVKVLLYMNDTMNLNIKITAPIRSLQKANDVFSEFGENKLKLLSAEVSRYLAPAACVPFHDGGTKRMGAEPQFGTSYEIVCRLRLWCHL